MLKPRGIFITGTDTGVGKTFVSGLLCQSLKNKFPITYFKPVQTGCELDSDTDSVVRFANLQEGEYLQPSYKFKAPLSPDRAAALEGRAIDAGVFLKDLSVIQDRMVIAEGAGGIEVPITPEYRVSCLIKEMGLPTLVVASTRLGTMNHTILTVEKLKLLGVPVMGVVLNGAEDPGLAEALKTQGISILGQIPQCEKDFLPALLEIEKVSEKILAQWFNSSEQIKKSQTFKEKDLKNIWHPFTQYGYDRSFPVVVSGDGSLLKLDSGEELVDGISSWWVNLHGHAHPELARTIAEQAYQLEQVIFSGYTHTPAIDLSEKILAQCSEKNTALQKVFYSDNGSTAVEVALKMAYQYQKQIGQTQRKKFLALKGSYHGDTLAAMSVSEREGFHKIFTPLMAPVDFIEPDDFSALERISQGMSEYAALIFEPLIQGAGGMRIYSSEFLQRLCKLCRDNGVLLVADEIFTGFFRTGSFLAVEQAAVEPDLVCLSKGLTGGFLPLSLTLTTQKIFSAFEDSSLEKAFLHGHSFTANPIACAVACKSLEILQREETQEQIKKISLWTREFYQEISQFPSVFQARRLGTIGAFEVKEDKGYFLGEFSRRFALACEKRGAIVRPLGSTVYTVPPYSTTQQQIQCLFQSIRETLFDIQRGSL